MSNVLVDTQALIWFAEGSPKLSSVARKQIDDLSITQFASAASIWEMAIKVRLGKLRLPSFGLSQFVRMLEANQFEMLAVSFEDAVRVSELPEIPHRDPFDRLIAAQCLRHDLTLVSSDKAFDDYGVRRVW